MTTLEKLLTDISVDAIPLLDLEKAFDDIAVELLRNTKLVSGKSGYLIKEIEFYFDSVHYRHPDPYAHSNQFKSELRQAEFGEWYFHHFKSPEAFLKNKHPGLDITFGNKRHMNFGGILLRQVESIETNGRIDGINKIVKAIANDIGIDEVKRLATETGKFVFDSASPLHLEVYSNSMDKPIFKTGRHLTFCESSEEFKYFNKYYCYFNHLDAKLVSP
jgi:hypothetical protein